MIMAKQVDIMPFFRQIGEYTPKFVDIVLMASKYFKNVLVASNGTTDYYLEELKSLKNIIFQIELY